MVVMYVVSGDVLRIGGRQRAGFRKTVVHHTQDHGQGAQYEQVERSEVHHHPSQRLFYAVYVLYGHFSPQWEAYSAYVYKPFRLGLVSPSKEGIEFGKWRAHQFCDLNGFGRSASGNDARIDGSVLRQNVDE